MLGQVPEGVTFLDGIVEPRLAFDDIDFIRCHARCCQ